MAENFRYGTLVSSKLMFVLTSFGQERLANAFRNDYSDSVRILTEGGGTSKLGTPVVDLVTLTDADGNSITLDTVIMEARVSNIIKETAVQGRAGKIKEYIAMDDYDIMIRGAVFSDNKDAFPTDQIKILNRLAKSAEVEVEGFYLNELLDVYTLVIKELKLPQRAGMASAQAFELHCVSETPYELEVSEDA